MNRCPSKKEPDRYKNELAEGLDLAFTKEEEIAFSEVCEKLDAKKLHSARLDSTGMDTGKVANLLDVTTSTIRNWRREPHYQKAVNLFVSITNRYGIQFRIKVQREIMAPAYGELMRRMHSEDLRTVSMRDLLSIIKTISEQFRIDTVRTSENSEDDDLKKLQERRVEASYYEEQKREIEELAKDNRIIKFASGTNGN